MKIYKSWNALNQEIKAQTLEMIFAATTVPYSTH